MKLTLKLRKLWRDETTLTGKWNTALEAKNFPLRGSDSSTSIGGGAICPTRIGIDYQIARGGTCPNASGGQSTLYAFFALNHRIGRGGLGSASVTDRGVSGKRRRSVRHCATFEGGGRCRRLRRHCRRRGDQRAAYEGGERARNQW